MAYITRRSLMQGAAGLVVAFHLPRAAVASVSTVAADSVDAYLAVAPDGGVTVFAGKVDLGTGARAAIRQIVAEELSLSPERIALVEGDTALTPDQGSTGGSTGIMVGGVQIRQAAATARAQLIALAAAQLQRPESDLETREGAVVVRGSGEAVSFAALIGGGAFNVPVDKSAPLRDPDTYTIVGTSYPRPDLPAKLTARHVYVQDHRVDGMWHARIVRPPAIGAKLLDVDGASLAGIPQAQIVRVRDFLAVVTPREWDAVRAMRALKATWSDAATLPGSDAMFEAVRATPVARTEMLRSVGDAAAVLDAAPQRDSRVLRLADPIARLDGPLLRGRGYERRRRHGVDCRRRARITCAGRSQGCSGSTPPSSVSSTWTARAVTAPAATTTPRSRLRCCRANCVARCACSGCGRTSTAGIRRARRSFLTCVRRSARTATSRRGKPSPWCRRIRRTTPDIPLLAAVAAGLDEGSGLFSGLLSLNADPPYAIANMRAEIRWQATTPLAAFKSARAGQDRQCLRGRELLRRTRGRGRRRSARLSAPPVARSARPGGFAARRRDDAMGTARRARRPQRQDSQRPRHRLCALQTSRELCGDGHGCRGRTVRPAPSACCAWLAPMIAV